MLSSGGLVEYHFLPFIVKSRQGNLPCNLIVIYFFKKVNYYFSFLSFFVDFYLEFRFIIKTEISMKNGNNLRNFVMQ